MNQYFMKYSSSAAPQSEGQGYDVMRQAAAPVAATAAIKAPSSLLAKRLLQDRTVATSAADKQVLDGMQRQWDKLGVTRVKNSPLEAMVGPHFNSLDKTIGSTTDNLGILAHETGHAKNFASIQKRFGNKGINAHRAGMVLGKLGGSLGLLGASAAALTGADDDTVRNIGIAGSASMVPLLAEETIASARGARMLRKLRVPLPGRLRAFSGLPTYIAAAAAPLAPWLGMKMYSKFKNPQQPAAASTAAPAPRPAPAAAPVKQPMAPPAAR